ncbi:MAG: ADP-ribosylglycohydrolase family protein [Tenericutes bacterium]|nr:ADP-ribosylglycohydrolase family protein [Mycoplasmatota bacterium]
MYGAIIGDLAGSIYEYSQLKSISNINADKIITEASFYSDDTILTIAILDAILNKGNYEEYLKKYIKKYANYKPDFTPYFKTPFSKGLIDWSNSSIVGTSTGNGAMMRISPVGYLFNTEESVIKNAQLATIPSHNSKEAVAAATIVALMIFYFRNGLSRDEVYQRLNIKIEYHPFKKFNTTCHETIGNCLYALYNSKSFEDAIRKTISMGGDTDTNACIVGSIAESMYPISPALISEAESKLPKEFVKILRM